MDVLTEVLVMYPKLSIEHVVALIALSAMALAAFAIYVVFAIARSTKKK